MKVRLRTPPQDAWQYGGPEPAPGWVRGCTNFWDTTLYLERRSGRQQMQKGEWLVQDLDGDPAWLTNDDFLRLYEVM